MKHIRKEDLHLLYWVRRLVRSGLTAREVAQRTGLPKEIVWNVNLMSASDGSAERVLNYFMGARS